MVGLGLLAALLLVEPPAGEGAGHHCFGKRATIVGGKQGQTLRGTRRADVIWGGGGRDVIKGRGGRDRICGVSGKDRLLGGAGNDRIDGGGRRDTLIGGPGFDRLRGGRAVDTCNIGSETTLKFTSCERFPLTITGKVALDTGGGANNSQVRVSATDGLAPRTVSTNAAGAYKATLTATKLPTDLRAQITFAPAGLPSVQSARETRARSNTPGLATAVVPNVAAAELTLAAGSAESADGATRISGAPPEIDRIFARAYNPATNAAAFPGTFEELGKLPLNSTLFVWIAALDSAGNSVHNLSSPMTIRSLVPSSQLKDLVDLEPGTGRIEIPIFAFDETANLWKAEGNGFLVDAAGGLIPEDAQAELVGGTFPGQVFSYLETDHLSWVNVDYPYFGPWDVSSTDPGERNECLGASLDLANTIIFSQKGQNALAPLNLPGADLKQELPNGVIKLTVEPPPPSVPPLAYGWFDPDNPGEIHLRQSLVDLCSAGPGQKIHPQTVAALTVYYAAVIVHEVAHWKFFNKHEGGNQDESEPGGHAGTVVDQQLWDGILSFFVDPSGQIGLERIPNGIQQSQVVSQSQIQSWLQAGTWPAPNSSSGTASPSSSPTPQGSGSPLDMTISLPMANFDLGEQITATVDYHNSSGQPIKVLDLDVLEGLPVWFEFVHQGSGDTVPYLPGWVRPNVDFDSDLTTIGAGQTIQRSFDLIVAGDGSALYNLIKSGNYSLTAHYTSAWGLPESQSNTLNISINPGGSVDGNVVDETTGLPLDDVTVRALQGEQIRDQTTTDFNGDYSFPELPAGTYTVDAKKLGYFRTTEPNVQVTDGMVTTKDLTLAPLVASDGIRLVLTWNELAADDLDSHLWLPPSKPFHIAYFRNGDLTECPFAELDIDIISDGGPETTTIGQLVGGDYLYAVHRFAGPTDLSQTSAQVKLFDAAGDLLNTYSVPNTGTDDWWELLQIDGDTGQVTVVNTLGADPAPYSDTSSGCS